ncbi:Crp/Fnr family transcriptional regulator [uncultured Eudoraea sp.]|jgi:CRP/FNR family transcriptional regulator|uniref:Crp/Fnr family transcriptional regulator n=1 Tax=uncultured Eudoraea sp. TaxID=1035614 RepID=UPI0026049572|nr:Crp/Fnr family transcriptional regulator [uncultured Eudoraea sp.]
MRVLLERHYGYLFEPELLDEIEAAGKCKLIKQGERLLDIGQDITVMPLIFSGAIKILREDDEGDELLLYFIEKGDTCAMTFSCCLGNGKSEIRAIAESDTELLMIPIEKMDEWMVKYQSWREFILDSYHTRMSELLETIDTLAFMKMDERIMKYLKDRAMVTNDDIIYSTHQDVANDLHTSRVVVSRLLKSLEKEGKIELSRNHIKVIEL